MKIHLTALLCLVSTLVWGADREIYVSAAKQPGKTTYKTLQQGINAAGKLKQQGIPTTLYIAGGTYVLDKALEVTARELGAGDTPLTICAVPGERVILQGGQSIPLSLITDVPDDDRIRPEVRGKLRFIDLNRAGVKEFGPLFNSGAGRPSGASWTEIFVNDQVQRISRWPNDTMALMGKVLETGSIPRWGDMANKGGTYCYDGDRPSQWKTHPKFVAGYFAHGYADDMLRVAKIDTVAKSITLAEAATYGLISGADFNRWYALNLLEEVDAPGEYYIDEERRQVWLYPSAEIESLTVSLLSAPLMAIEGVKNVEVRGLEFTCTRGIGAYMERTQGVVIRGCKFYNIGNLAVCMGRGVAPFPVHGHVPTEADSLPLSRAVGSYYQYVFAFTAFDRQAGTNNGVVDCVIHDVGAGGIGLSGGNKLTLEPGNNYVQNCRISQYCRIERTYRPGVDISGVGNRISNCEIFDSPSLAILMRGNDHLIEYNEIHNVCNEIDDLGAIYYGRNQTELGIRIMYNYIHDLSAKHRVTGIYHDDGACGTLSYGNILYKAGLHPFLVGGGSDNRIENNMVIDAQYGIYVDDRLENWAGNRPTDSVLMAHFEEVNFGQPPYSTHYPYAANYIEEGYKFPKRNVALKNLFYNVDDLIRQGERVYEDGHIEMYNNYITMRKFGFAEPGFVDESQQNWNLRSDAKLLQVVPGFEPIPFDKIGCSLPRE